MKAMAMVLFPFPAYQKQSRQQKLHRSTAFLASLFFVCSFCVLTSEYCASSMGSEAATAVDDSAPAEEAVGSVAKKKIVVAPFIVKLIDDFQKNPLKSDESGDMSFLVSYIDRSPDLKIMVPINLFTWADAADEKDMILLSAFIIGSARYQVKEGVGDEIETVISGIQAMNSTYEKLLESTFISEKIEQIEIYRSIEKKNELKELVQKLKQDGDLDRD